MAQIIETTVYQYDELSDAAKEKAREWYRSASEQDFSAFQAESVIEDAARLSAMIGLDIRQRTAKLMGGGTRQEPEVYYSGFWSQGDGASFCGRYEYRKGGTAVLAAEAPIGEGKGYEGNNEINRIARELADVQRRNFYRVQASVDGRTHRGFTLAIDVERADDCPMSDEDIETVKECMRDVAGWIYRSLEREYEYQNSDEVVEENIRANEYTFREDGRRSCV